MSTLNKIAAALVFVFLASCSEENSGPPYELGELGELGFFFVRDGFTLDSTTVEWACLGERDGNPEFQVMLTEKGNSLIASLTSEYVGGYMAFHSGTEILMLPKINTAIEGDIPANIAVTEFSEAEKIQQLFKGQGIDCDDAT